MTGSTGTAQKKSTVDKLAESYRPAAKNQTKSKVKDTASTEKFAKIDTNPFFKIITSDGSPTEKKSAIAKALTFAGDKKETQKALSQFEEFKAYLQFERKNMAKQIVDLTDTETMSLLQDVLRDMNDSMIDFEKDMTPLTEILEALHDLREAGLTFDVYHEIVKDREAEEAIQIKRTELEDKLGTIEEDMRSIRRQNATLSNDKSLFGFGSITKDSQNQISINEVTLKEKEAQLKGLTTEIQETIAESRPDSEFEEYATQKDKLRELLDISSDQHKERQERLITSARNFIDDSDARVGDVLVHLDKSNKQVDGIVDANFQMRQMYVILNEGTKVAEDANQEVRNDLMTSMDGLDEIVKLEKEEKLRHVNTHINALVKSDSDTRQVLGDLTQQQSRVSNMKESNDQQIANTQSLHTSGIAGVADQLATALTSLGQASLGEASSMANNTINRMNRYTSDIYARDAFRVASGMQGQNAEIATALEGLEEFGNLVKQTSEIRRSALQNGRELLNEYEKKASEVHEDVKKATADAADVLSKFDSGPANDDGPVDAPAAKRPSAFNLG